MSRSRLEHPGFDSVLGVLLDYLIHGSGGLGCVSEVYSPEVGLKGPTLVKFHVLKNRTKQISPLTEYVSGYFSKKKLKKF
jgi:hypothetical protein